MSTPETVLYFAYGSDMSLRQMQQRLLESEIYLDDDNRCAAKLADHVLRFDKAIHHHPEIGLACIHAQAGSVVEGVLYELPAKAMAVLDTWEDVANGHYRRIPLEVQTASETKLAQVYVPAHDKIKAGL